jgi:hypothetical protein
LTIINKCSAPILGVFYTYKPQAATQRGAEIPKVSNAVAEAQATEHDAADTAFPLCCSQFFTFS